MYVIVPHLTTDSTTSTKKRSAYSSAFNCTSISCEPHPEMPCFRIKLTFTHKLTGEIKKVSFNLSYEKLGMYKENEN